MGSENDQGAFESDEHYRRRKQREADEATIRRTTGSPPSQGWFESDERYETRARREANEGVVEDLTGSKPSQAWFESDERYTARVEQDAHERTVEAATGSAPTQGLFESDEKFLSRSAREAHEAVIAQESGSRPTQGFFEDDAKYRRRLALEAAEWRSRSRSDSSDGEMVKFIVILVLVVMAIAVGLMILTVALAVAAVASVAQWIFAEAARQRLGPAVRLFARKGHRVAWIGVTAGLLVGALAVPDILRSGDGFLILIVFAGLVAGAVLSYRASAWIVRKRLDSLDLPALTQTGLVEPHPAVLYGLAGLLALAYAGGGYWLSTKAGRGLLPVHASRPSVASQATRPPEVLAPGTRPTISPGLPGFAPAFLFADVPDFGFLTLRTEPSTKGERVDAIPHRNQAEILNVEPVPDTVDDLAGRWLYVRSGNAEGWVFDGYLKEQQPPELELENVDRWAVVKEPDGGHINVRAWSSVGSRIVGELAPGSRVFVESCRLDLEIFSSGKPGRWCRVQQDGLSGWAFDAHLEKEVP
jgi:Bacterial SH3 domain